jgi:hypothetical protein
MQKQQIENAEHADSDDQRLAMQMEPQAKQMQDFLNKDDAGIRSAKRHDRKEREPAPHGGAEGERTEALHPAQINLTAAVDGRRG